MRSVKIILLFFMIHSAHGTIFKSYDSIQAAIGPAWCKYSFGQIFELDQALLPTTFLPSADLSSAPYQLLPYFQGTIKLTPYKNFNILFSASGGFLKNQIGYFNLPIPGEIHPYSELVETTLPTLFAASTTTIDAAIGYRFFNTCNTFAINPLLGYLYNRQRPVLFIYTPNITYDYRTSSNS